MSSSKSSSAQTTQSTDNRAVLGEGAFQATTGGTVNSYVLDGGAINRAFDSTDKTVDKAFSFGGQAFDFTERTVDRALDYGTAATSAALSNLQATQKLTAEAYADAKGRGALTDKILIGAILAMGAVAFMAVRKG
jgi:hypothetical protein